MRPHKPMPQLKDVARFKVSLRPEDYRNRKHSIIKLLAEEGAMSSQCIAYEIGYQPNGAYAMLAGMVADSTIVRTNARYHLKGQSPEPKGLSRREADTFFEGSSKLAKARRYIRDHQDEPLLMTDVGKVVGYANDSGAHVVMTNMMDKGILRRYHAPEDRNYLWRYQYTDPRISGVTVTKPAEEPATEPAEDWADGEVEAAAPIELKELESKQVQEELQDEVEIEESWPEQPASKLEQAVVLTDHYAKEFFWQTGSSNLKEYTLWLRERLVAEKEVNNATN